MWKHIRNGWITFSEHVKLLVGDGSLIFFFWHDVWCGDEPLRILFPDLYENATNKQASIDRHMYRHNNAIHWCPLLIGSLKPLITL